MNQLSKVQASSSAIDNCIEDGGSEAARILRSLLP